MKFDNPGLYPPVIQARPSKLKTQNCFWVFEFGFYGFMVFLGLCDYGIIGLWVYGFMCFGFLGFIDFWVFGFMGFWVYGFMGLCVFGFLGFLVFG